MRIVVLGAGLIGTYVGAALHAAGADVGLIGRSRMRAQVESQPLVLTDLDGGRTVVPAGSLDYREEPDALADADLVLVAVKSADTGTAADLIAASGAKPLVVSVQNGIGNADVLRERLPGVEVLAGIVAFNVASPEPGRLHRATEGGLMVAVSTALIPWQQAFASAGLPITPAENIVAVQWGKLLLNLNNAVNALAGVPLGEELSQRDYRRCLALLVAEALAALRAAGLRPAPVTKVPPRALPTLLRVPDAVFTRLAGAMLRIDPEARSSMWEDLSAGRRTEVDFLNGAVVSLARSAGIDAPANRAIVALVHAADGTSFSGADLYRRLRSSR